MVRTNSLLRYLVLIMIASMVIMVIGCSQPSAPTPTTNTTAPLETTSPPASSASPGATTTTKTDDPAASSGEKIVIKVAASGFPLPGGPEEQLSDQVIALNTFEQQLKKYTDKVELQIFHGTLGDQTSTYQGARLGVPAPMATGAVNNLDPFAPCLTFINLPYMWKDYKQLCDVMYKLWDEVDQALIKEAGVRAVQYYVAGWRDLSNSKKPVKTIDDLQGLKVRVPPSKMLVGTYKAWGIEPMSLGYSELYQALQQKVVDGHDLCAPAQYSGKFHEVQKYYTRLHYNPLVMVTVIGEQFYSGLPKDVQDAITKAGRESLELSLPLIEKAEDVSLQEMQKAGLEITELTDEAEWEARAKKTWPDFYPSMGSGKAFADKAEELKKAQ
jgi:TRAP-type C4-dicarboxylate transport system substrate-binding protein